MFDIIVLLLVLVALIVSLIRFNLHPFLALILAGMVFGVSIGMDFNMVMESLLTGFANVLKWIAIIMILGTIIGEILNETGNSQRISNSIINTIGPKRVSLAMGATGYVVSIPVFVDVAYIMLQPITESIAAKSKKGILVTGLSLTAGLTATHALLPPTPGPLAAAGIIDADLGKVIMINSIVAIFATAGGLLWASLYCKKYRLKVDEHIQERVVSPKTEQTSISKTLLAYIPILLPLALISASSFVKDANQTWYTEFLLAIGSPVVALMIGLLAAIMLLSKRNKLKKIESLFNLSIRKSADVIMITGAGGALGGVLKASDIGATLSSIITEAGVPGLLIPFLLAASITTATGSLTVSMVTATTIITPLLSSLHITPEIAVAAVGAGSFCVFHANSSFFWLLSRLHKVEPKILLRTYSLQSLIMGLSAFSGVALLYVFDLY